ncbi:MAG: glycosyltransferase family 4 protein [Anaerolineae bacterium]|nr:glycosyltransferase family 4 protein [Anaerolineae bacterium]
MQNQTQYLKKFATTVRLQTNSDYAAQARVLAVPDMLPNSKYRSSDELRLFREVLKAAFGEKTLLLNACRGRFKPELCATVLLNLWPKRYRPKVVMYGDMFQQTPGLQGKIERVIMKVADRAIMRYVVITAAESDVFPQVWGIDKTKMRVCPYFLEQKRHDKGTMTLPKGQHIFAGGNSFRNFEPLIEAARQLPEYEFVLCTSRLKDRTDLPCNVKAGLVSHEQYVKLISTAAAVVIPLKTGMHRVAGLQTCFDAMWAKKPTIVTEALGVREYIDHRKTGMIVDGSPQSYAAAIRWVLDPGNQEAVAHMCEQAHAILRDQYTLDNHIDHLLAVIDEVIEQS